MTAKPGPSWPSLPWAEWRDTLETVHMWAQIVGKTRLTLCPSQNHWWHVPLYVTARGLSTSKISHKSLTFDVEFDFFDHLLRIRSDRGEERTLSLAPRTVADFYSEYLKTLRSMGVDLILTNPRPDETPDKIPFADDTLHSSYDPAAMHRFFIALAHVDSLLKQFQGRFLGKSSPVHFFWGSFDLAVTRFSGRRAPERPHTDRITREAYSHEVISAGFWPGDQRFPEAAFYSYAAPAQPDLEKEVVRPGAAFYSHELGEFLLRYEDVRLMPDPNKAVMDFLQSTYDSAARLANWNRAELEREALVRSTPHEA